MIMRQAPQGPAEFGTLDLSVLFAEPRPATRRAIVRCHLTRAGLHVHEDADANDRLDLAIDMLPREGSPDPLDWFVLSRATAETDWPRQAAERGRPSGWLWRWIMGSDGLTPA